MKKLNLNKEVIATLNDGSMNRILGGEELTGSNALTDTTKSCDPSRCPTTCGACSYQCPHSAGALCDSQVICREVKHLTNPFET